MGISTAETHRSYKLVLEYINVIILSGEKDKLVKDLLNILRLFLNTMMHYGNQYS